MLSRGNADEVYSRLELDTVRRVETTHGIARGHDGRLLASRELYLVICQETPGRRPPGFLQVRGVHPVALDVHRKVTITCGRLFQPGRREVIVGRSKARQQNLDVGDRLSFGRIDWDVVGIFEAAGSSFDSEVWGDLGQVADAFRRQDACSSVVLRAADPPAARALIDRLQARKLSVGAQTEVSYYQEQAEQVEMLRAAAVTIAFFMATGAVFAVAMTMVATISHRIKDLAVMRILGFSQLNIVAAVVLETLMIVLIGGTVGAVLGYGANGLTLSTAVGDRDVSFAFTVSGSILLQAAVFTIVMGMIGAVLPALWAVRMTPLESLQRHV